MPTLSVKVPSFGRRFKYVQVLLELALVVWVGLYAARDYSSSDPQLVLVGLESQWLTSSAYQTANVLQGEGYLTRWNPWLGHGEPAIGNPFSFALNPISALPSWLLGAGNGIKFSIVLYTILAGVGGWVLASVLSLGWLGRLLLALVLIGRGSMHAEISLGYYQLGVTQAYFPWVTAAVLAIIRFRTRRAPIVLLAITLTLLFWAGNIYYTLPMLIVVGLLTLAFMIRVERRRLHVDTILLRRVVLALLLTVGLAAATLVPIYANQQYIGGHPNENPDNIYEDPLISAAEFFTSVRLYSLDTWHETYYSFVLPLWFALLIFAVFPITAPRLHRFADPKLHPRVYALGLVMIVIFFVWGTKALPGVVNWLYAHLPLIGQWRTMSRMLTVSAFWVAVLVAMRVDGLWRALVIDRRLDRWVASIGRVAGYLHWLVAAVLIVACALAANELIQTWFDFGATDYRDKMTITCIDWLRQQHPDENLTVFGRDYYQVAIYLDDHVRFSNINADFHPIGMATTLYDDSISDPVMAFSFDGSDLDLRSTPPEYLISYDNDERRFWTERGYRIIPQSPLDGGGISCLMRNPDVLSYAFTVPLRALQTVSNTLPPESTTPVWLMNRHADYVGLLANGEVDRAVAAGRAGTGVARLERDGRRRACASGGIRADDRRDACRPAPRRIKSCSCTTRRCSKSAG